MFQHYFFGIWNTDIHTFGISQPECSFMDMIAFGAMKVTPIVYVSYAVGLGSKLFSGL